MVSIKINLGEVYFPDDTIEVKQITCIQTEYLKVFFEKFLTYASDRVEKLRLAVKIDKSSRLLLEIPVRCEYSFCVPFYRTIHRIDLKNAKIRHSWNGIEPRPDTIKAINCPDRVA